MSVPNKFVEFSKEIEVKRAELLDLISSQQLGSEEAAQSLAGWRLKWADTHNHPAPQGPAAGNYHENLYRQCLVDIESRLPGWAGLEDRHLSV